MVLQNPDDQIISSVVEEDAAFGPENLGLSGAELEERVRWALGRCNLNHLKKRAPRFLSGGEKQRLALAGALAMKTPVLALDEAVSMLDPRGREDFLSLLDELSGEGKTILHITHSLEEAFRCRRALVLHRGRLVFDGPPAELLPLGRELEEWGFVLPGPAAFRRLVPALSTGTAASAVFSVEKTAKEIITALGGGAFFDAVTTDTAAATDAIATAAAVVAPAVSAAAGLPGIVSAII